MVEALFRQATGAALDPGEWEQIAERLIHTFAAALPSEVSTLPDDALKLRRDLCGAPVIVRYLADTNIFLHFANHRDPLHTAVRAAILLLRQRGDPDHSGAVRRFCHCTVSKKEDRRRFAEGKKRRHAARL